MEQQNEEELLENLKELKEYEVFTKDQMLPTKFEPLNSARFLCEHDDIIDSFLVKRIEKLPLHRKHWKTHLANLFGIKLKNPPLTCAGNIIVVYHSPISPSSIGQIYDAFQEGAKINLTMKHLNPTGTVVSLRKYKNCAIKSFELSSPDYSQGNKIEEIKVTYSCKSMDFIY